MPYLSVKKYPESWPANKVADVNSGQKLGSTRAYWLLCSPISNWSWKCLTDVCKEATEGVEEESVTELDAVMYLVLYACNTKRCMLFHRGRTTTGWNRSFTAGALYIWNKEPSYSSGYPHDPCWRNSRLNCKTNMGGGGGGRGRVEYCKTCEGHWVSSWRES